MKRRDFLKWSAGSVALAFPPIILTLASPSPPASEATRKISIVGIGGCGVRTVTRMLTEFSKPNLSRGVELAYYAIDTDERSLHRDTQHPELASNALTRVWISAQYPSCVYPEQGRKVAWRNRTRIADELKLGTASEFIVLAGFGRGCGTGFAQSISYLARMEGVPAFVCPILPFSFSIVPGDVEHELARLNRTANRVSTFSHDESDMDASIMDLMASCERNAIAFATELIALRSGGT